MEKIMYSDQILILLVPNAQSTTPITCSKIHVDLVLYSSDYSLDVHTFKQRNRQNWFSGAKYFIYKLFERANIICYKLCLKDTTLNLQATRDINLRMNALILMDLANQHVTISSVRAIYLLDTSIHYSIDVVVGTLL